MSSYSNDKFLARQKTSPSLSSSQSKPIKRSSLEQHDSSLKTPGRAWGLNTKPQSQLSTNVSLLWASRHGTFASTVPMPPTAQHPNGVLPPGALACRRTWLQPPPLRVIYFLQLSSFSQNGLRILRAWITPSAKACCLPLDGSFFRSRCVPIIKYLPCFSKIYSETVFQTPVYSSRRTVVCFCSDGNQTQNIVEARPIELIPWFTPSPTLPGSWFYFNIKMRYLEITPPKRYLSKS